MLCYHGMSCQNNSITLSIFSALRPPQQNYVVILKSTVFLILGLDFKKKK